MKKVLSVLMAAIILFALSTVAFAATTVEVSTAAEFVDAVTNANDGDTIKLTGDIIGPGVKVKKSITIDFGGYTYTFTDPATGSVGTETLGFQLLKESSSVTLKNGKLDVDPAYASKYAVLVQNYTNLHLIDMVLDGTYLDRYTEPGREGTVSYTLSINCGEVNIDGNTTIISSGDEHVAFDVYDYSSGGYEHPSVLVNTTGTIQGKIEVSDTITDPLTVKSGEFTEFVDIQEYCQHLSSTCQLMDEMNHQHYCGVCQTKLHAEAHEMGEWVVVEEPTTMKTGLQIRECTADCGYVEEDRIARIEDDDIGELVIPESQKPAAEDKDNGKSNPATGSSDFVNVAVALGVVSLAAAAAVIKK